MPSNSKPSAVLRILTSPALPPDFAASASFPASNATAAPERTTPERARNSRRAAAGVGISKNDISVSLVGDVTSGKLPAFCKLRRHAGDDAVAARAGESECVAVGEVDFL